MNRLALILGALLVAPLLTGCASDAVVFVTATNLGVEISGGQGPGGAKVGYQRSEYVSMPLAVEEQQGADGETSETLREAFPVLAMFEMSTGRLVIDGGALRVRQTFATGKAARMTTSVEAVGKAFVAAGGDRIPDEGSVLAYQDIVQAAGPDHDDPADDVVAAVERRLLGGQSLDAAAVEGFIRARGLADDEERLLLGSVPESPGNQLRWLLRFAAEDGRGDVLERIREDIQTSRGDADGGEVPADVPVSSGPEDPPAGAAIMAENPR